MKVLVIRVDHLGDLLLTTPVLRALAKSGATVDLLIKGSNAAIIQNNPHVTRLEILETVVPDFPRGWQQLARWIKARAYDVVILPHAQPKELLWASFASGAKQRVAMWSGVWGRLTLHRCLRSRIHANDRHFSDIVLDCARALNVDVQGTYPEIFLTDAEREHASQSINKHFPGRPTIIGIHPGSSGKNACNLPASEYGLLADLILKFTDCSVVVTGVRAEKSLLAGWPENVLQSDRFWDSMGEVSLRQLAALIREMSVYICPSTGPLHIASAVKTSTLSPFCRRLGLNSVIWGNQGALSEVVEPSIENCQKLGVGEKAVCDFGGEVTAAILFQRLKRLLEKRGKV